MNDLTEAIADLKTLQGEIWDECDFGIYHHDRAKTIATILNAVASGELIPATEHDAAVAAALEEAVTKAIKKAEHDVWLALKHDSSITCAWACRAVRDSHKPENRA